MIQQFTRFRGINSRVHQQNRTTFNRELTGLFRGCGQNWTPNTVRFSLHWVINVTNVASSIFLQRYVGKNSKNPQQSKRIKNVDDSENTDQPDNQNVIFFEIITKNIILITIRRTTIITQR